MPLTGRQYYLFITLVFLRKILRTKKNYMSFSKKYSRKYLSGVIVLSHRGHVYLMKKERESSKTEVPFPAKNSKIFTAKQQNLGFLDLLFLKNTMAWAFL